MYKREIICLKSGSSHFHRLHVYMLQTSSPYVTRYKTGIVSLLRQSLLRQSFHSVQLSYSCLELRLDKIWWYSPGCMVGVLMTVGVMSVGEITVGVMTVVSFPTNSKLTI
jgi:hypothetical protein